MFHVLGEFTEESPAVAWRHLCERDAALDSHVVRCSTDGASVGGGSRAKFTLLFSHANAEDLGLIFEHLKILSQVLQVNVMGYDYTGYGHSSGRPSEADCYADITAAFSWLIQVSRRVCLCMLYI